MSINEFLINKIDPFLYTYGCYNSRMIEFIAENLSYRERQKHAIEMIKVFMTDNGKKELYQHVSNLASIEFQIRALTIRQRDHVYHGLLTFLLGIYLDEYFLKPVYNSKYLVFPWKLAGLFHDIGYPVEISYNFLEFYADSTNKEEQELLKKFPDIFSNNMPPPISFAVRPTNLECLYNKVNSIDLIQKCIESWGLQINAYDEYELFLSGGRTCHGIVSSLTLIRVIDRMYQLNNPNRLPQSFIQGDNIDWDQRNFLSYVVPACAAIFIHNLPNERFEKSKIDPTLAPLPFLLRLSDNLQEWQRPSNDNPSGYDPNDFDLNISGRKLIFNVKEHDLSEKIHNTISQSLVDDFIEIR
jgi:hypothetical protein